MSTTTGVGPRRRLPAGSKRRAGLIGTVSAVGCVIVWYLVTSGLHLVSPLLLPGPDAVAGRFVEFLYTPYLGHTLIGHTAASVKIVLLGWALGGVVGVPTGVLMGWSRRFRSVVSPLFQFMRPIPPIAWIPLAILWFGLGDSARIYVVWLAAVVPWVLNSFEAVRSVDALLPGAARTLGASGRRILAEVVLPTSLPVIISGARIAIGNAWMTVVAAEMLAANSGLGFIALTARRTLDPDIMLTAMGIIGVLGLAFTAALHLVERKISPWRAPEGDTR